MDIYMVRHGEMDASDFELIDFNLINNYITGRKEKGITPRGVAEMKRVADFFQNKGINAVYSSNFLRSQESADVLCERLGLEKNIISDLGEVNVGELDPEHNPGLQKILSFTNKLYRTNRNFATRFVMPVVGKIIIYTYLFRWLRGRTIRGETISEAIARFERSFQQIINNNPIEAKIILLTHGYFISLNARRAIRRHRRDMLKMGNPFWIANGSVTKFTLDKDLNLRLQYFARRKHLRGLNKNEKN